MSLSSFSIRVMLASWSNLGIIYSAVSSERDSKFQIGKGVCQGCILSPCLFNLYAEYIMTNGGLDEARAQVKTVRRNINNLRYADDNTLMAESEEELKSL